MPYRAGSLRELLAGIRAIELVGGWRERRPWPKELEVFVKINCVDEPTTALSLSMPPIKTIKRAETSVTIQFLYVFFEGFMEMV